MANATNSMKNRPEGNPSNPYTGIDPNPQTHAGNLTDKAHDLASSVANRASEFASDVGEKAESATSAVGGSLKSAAETIREHTPDVGFLKSAASGVANTLESGGRYLQEEGLSGMGEDLTNLIRRNPLPALMVGVALGFLLARATRG